MAIHVTNPCVCPWCAKPSDAAINAADEGDRYPRDGDITVCVGCLNPAIYVAGPLGIAHRRPTPAEWEEYGSVFSAERERCQEFVRRCRAEGIVL